MAGKQKKGGRYTPKASQSADTQRRPATPAGRSGRPGRAGRSARSEPAAPKAARRPSPPAVLFLNAALWLACGVVVTVKVHASWKVIPAVVFVGIGVFYLRAALRRVLRRGDRIDENRHEG